MKRIAGAFILLLMGGVAFAGQGVSSSLTVSSGTFKPIQLFTNNSGNSVQGIAVADSSYTVTAPVDSVQGLTVNLGTSTLTTATAVKVDGSATTQPISGNVGQSGTWTVQPGNTANTTAWKVDGSAVTQPISGTVTAAQTANASLRASVDIDGSSNTVVLGAGAATIGALTANQSVNIAQINGVTPLMGNGVTGTGSPRVTIAADNTAFSVNLTTSVVNTIGGYLVCTSTFANVAASQTAQVLLGAVASTTFRVMSFHAVAGGTATNLTFNSNSTAISPLYANAANGGLVVNYSPLGHFQTNSGESLTVTTGAGSTTGMNISYCKF